MRQTLNLALTSCAYRLIWATRLHHEMIFTLPDGGFHQVNLAFVTHPAMDEPHAFIIASHQDHEGPWQEFISCDELLDCCGWDDFLENLYGYRLDSGLDLSVTNRDAFYQLMPEWMDLPFNGPLTGSSIILGTITAVLFGRGCARKTCHTLGFDCVSSSQLARTPMGFMGGARWRYGNL